MNAAQALALFEELPSGHEPGQAAAAVAAALNGKAEHGA